MCSFPCKYLSRTDRLSWCKLLLEIEREQNPTRPKIWRGPLAGVDLQRTPQKVVPGQQILS